MKKQGAGFLTVFCIFALSTETCAQNISPPPEHPFKKQEMQYSGPPAPSLEKLDTAGNPLPESAVSWVMVRDNVTGLVWEAKEAGDGIQDYTNPHDADNTYTWCDTDTNNNRGFQGTCGTADTAGFLAALNSGSGFAGHNDWRLPTIQELETLVDFSRNNPAINPIYFPKNVSSFYWASSTYAGNASYAWFVNFKAGNPDSYNKSDMHYVRAVRGGRVSPENRFVVNPDGTVTDTATCLQWQRATADIDGNGRPDQMTLQSALAYAGNLSLGGHEDWRVPDINELSSIVDFGCYRPAINTTNFHSTMEHNYWSSTSSAVNKGNLWSVTFYNGYTYDQDKYKKNYLRVVRGGKCENWGTNHFVVVPRPDPPL